MHAFKTRPHRRPARAQQPARPAAPDLRHFQPMVHVARRKVDELLQLGATLHAVTARKVTLKRMGQTATIDDFGRVDWLQ